MIMLPGLISSPPSRTALSCRYELSSSSKARSSQNMTNFSDRTLIRSPISKRCMRASRSISIMRSPFFPYSFRSDLIADDLPVPLGPYKRTLLQGSPPRNCSVFPLSFMIMSSMPLSSLIRTGSGSAIPFTHCLPLTE